MANINGPVLTAEERLAGCKLQVATLARRAERRPDALSDALMDVAFSDHDSWTTSEVGKLLQDLDKCRLTVSAWILLQ